MAVKIHMAYIYVTRVMKFACPFLKSGDLANDYGGLVISVPGIL